MDDVLIPLPKSPRCPFCENERISCDSKKPTPLVQAVMDACDRNFAGLLKETKQEK